MGAAAARPIRPSAIPARADARPAATAEIVDDWGDRPEHRDPTSTASFIGTCGRQAFLEYQRQLSDPDVLSAADRPHTDLIVQYYGSTAVIMLDVRYARLRSLVPRWPANASVARVAGGAAARPRRPRRATP